MEALEKRILTEGEIRPGGILKVDGFLNHRIDPQLSYDMAMELKRLYEGTEINKVLTIEASGIAMACITFIMGSTDNLGPATYGLFTDTIHAAFSICLVMCIIGLLCTLSSRRRHE